MKGKLFIFSDKSLVRDNGLKKTTEPELRSLGIETKVPIHSASLCSLAEAIPGLLKRLQIRALDAEFLHRQKGFKEKKLQKTTGC
jgi:hypothetical protein